MSVRSKGKVVQSLSRIRADLMSMQAGLTHEDEMPKPEEIKAAVAKLESLLKVLEKND